MREGSGLVKFSQQYPDRYFDVAIAEQHAVTFAAGLAIADQKPVVAICSSFLQRAYDQLIHDVALQNLPVLFAIDRAGLVGPTARPIRAFDISFLRTVPNMVVMTPSDENESRQMLYTGYLCNGPAAVRYPVAAAPVSRPRARCRPCPSARDVSFARAGDRHPGVRHPAATGQSSRRGAGCHPGGHALRQTHGRGAGALWPPPTISSSPSRTTPSWAVQALR